MAHWLVKTEPTVFSYENLVAAPGQCTSWEGVRNYQARNMLRDELAVGDGVFVYHSNCPEPGIVGLAEVVRAGYPDPFAFDPKSRYFDPKSKRELPRWYLVDIRATRALRRTITLGELKADRRLEGFALVRRGNRLSVMPVSAEHWEHVLSLE